ncbi:caspase domain-containing protein [Streptomyces sp. NPDC058457]|uniref:caspase family protein n=1 Tax=Streptomyces sp. NPDC058457 TaxID=3346507 RepID=UPI003649B7B8
MGRRLALLIATYDYQDTGLQRLAAPAHDAEAFAAVLQDPAIAGFEVTTLVNEPHHVVGETIGDFYRHRRRDDLTLLYFTGHGLKDDGGRLYLAMSNTRRDSLLFTALSAEQIDQAMEGCVSRQKVLILDCCYSGAFPAGRLAKADTAVHTLEQFQGRGRTVLTASDATQYSFEGNQPHGQAAQSVFTRHLVAGLRDGSADLDGDITLDELYSYVHDRVVEEMPQQRPKRQDNVEGRTVIARNINWVLPTHLRNALGSPIATDRLGAIDALAHQYRIGNDFVRQHVASEFQRLADDDSRIVSTAAAAQLEAIHPKVSEAPSRPAPEPSPAPAPTSAPAPTIEQQATPPDIAPRAAPSRGRGQDMRPGRNLAALHAESAGRVRSQAAATLVASITGVLPVLAAVLLIAGTVKVGDSDGYFSSLFDPWSAYVITMAAVALTAGVCMLVPRTRSLIGPGLVLGTAAASVWGLVYYSQVKTHDWLPMDQFAFAGQVALMVGGCLAGFTLRGNRVVHFELWQPTNLLTRVMAFLAGMGAVTVAVALLREGNATRSSLSDPHVPNGWPYFVTAVLAVAVPVSAAALAPRTFGLSLLTGWVGGASAIARDAYAWARAFDDPYVNVIIFGCGGLVLTAAAVVMFRWSAR